MDDLSQPIEEEIVIPVDETEGAEPAPKTESVRETLVKALKDSKSGGETPEKTGSESKAAPKAEKERDGAGKFAKTDPKAARKAKVAVETDATDPIQGQAQVEHEIAAPETLAPQLRAKWADIPKDVQQEFSRLAQNFHKELTRHDEERVFGRQMKDVVTPYVAQIRAEGAEPAQAVANLLNMAHVLRVGSPQQKSDLLLRTAQTFGVDLRRALQVQQTQPQLPPQVQSALQEVQNIRSELEREKALKEQREDSDIQEQIKAFSADPKHVHFETVRTHMGALIKSGIAKDMRDAYDQAVYANPHTRSTLLQQQEAASKEKRVAEQKARAEAARKAGSSLKGSPGISASKNAKVNGLDLRSTIKSAMAEHMDG